MSRSVAENCGSSEAGQMARLCRSFEESNLMQIRRWTTWVFPQGILYAYLRSENPQAESV